MKQVFRQTLAVILATFGIVLSLFSIVHITDNWLHPQMSLDFPSLHVWSSTDDGKYEHFLRFVKVYGNGELHITNACTGTAVEMPEVQEDIVLTATHCENSVDIGRTYLWSIDGKVIDDVRAIARDDQDHSLFFLKGSTFLFKVPIDYKDTLKEDKIHFSGFNISTVFYREGYWMKALDFFPFRVYTAFAYPGDSGAGIFNRNGQLVGVVSSVITGKGLHSRFMVAFPFSKWTLYDEQEKFRPVL